MGRSHRLMSSLKLSGSPPFFLTKSSSSVHVMRRGSGPSWFHGVRRSGATDGREARATARSYRNPAEFCELTSSQPDVYPEESLGERRPMTYNQAPWLAH